MYVWECRYACMFVYVCVCVCVCVHPKNKEKLYVGISQIMLFICN